MSSFQLYDSLTGESSHGFIWPLEDSRAGGIPSVTSWRQWGHSWAAGGFDDFNGERNRSRITERIAGMMHLPPHAVANEAASGSAVMDALGAGAIGFGRVLQRCKPHALTQNWPWEPNRFGVEAALWGVNDVGGISGSLWPEQAAMWDLVWANTMRSIIQRFIAGAIYLPDATGLSPAVFHVPPPSPGARFTFVPNGPGGTGGPAAGGWVFKTDNRANSGPGYWYTTMNGATMVIAVPVDYDTGSLALRHLCPGSYFDGPVQTRNPFGVIGGGSQPQAAVRTGAEHPRSPNAVTVVGGNVNDVVNCRGLANRTEHWGTNPGPGLIDGPNKPPPNEKDYVGPGAMTHVSRHALTPTPGTVQTLTLTVGGLPAGGWYGFDSFEIEAKPELRPIVIMANVAQPVNLGLYFVSLDAYPLYHATMQRFSNILETVCAEYADPGVMVADIRSAIATDPIAYGELTDPAMDYRLTEAIVESSSSGTGAGTGDGTHPHAIGERLIIGAHLDALAKANLPRGRGAIPFAPSRSLAYGRSSGD